MIWQGTICEELHGMGLDLGKTTKSDRNPNPITNPNPYLVAVQYGSLALTCPKTVQQRP